MATQNPPTRNTLIDDYALARIDYRVRQLAERFNLPQDQQEACRHDMVVELLSAFRRFNPDKAKRETFINRVLDLFVKYTTRVRCTHRRRPSDNPIHFDDIAPGYQPVINDPPTGQIDEQGRCELRIDMDAAVARMPSRLRRVCRLLMKFDPAEAAKQLGICRQSIYRNIWEIRGYLAGAGLGTSKNGATNSPRLQM